MYVMEQVSTEIAKSVSFLFLESTSETIRATEWGTFRYRNKGQTDDPIHLQFS